MSTKIICGLVALLVAVPFVRGADEETIKRAVARGVGALRASQIPGGAWEYAGHNVGATGLAGLALLEAGVKGDEDCLVRAAQTIREQAISITQTYDISLAILFLERMGNPRDVALIESLMVRLLGGQLRGGGWSYECPKISADEERRLRGSQDRRVVEKDIRPSVKDLPKEIQDQLGIIEKVGPEVLNPGNPLADNSNTQFATLALWVGRRHGLPVDKALARIEQRFRVSQNVNGGWGYNCSIDGGDYVTRPAMTCAGLLGLAVAYGHAFELEAERLKADAAKSTKNKPIPDPSKDVAIRAGLVALATMMGRDRGWQNEVTSNNDARAAFIQPGPPGAKARITLRPSYYYLWSIERVAMAYNLTQIGKIDWYKWGSDVICFEQQEDGSWRNEQPGAVDTSFALLFLTRSNLARDLSAALRGRMGDLAEVRLKAGSSNELSKPVGPKPGNKGETKVGMDLKLPQPSLIGGAPVDPAVAELVNELVKAAPDKQPALIEKLRDGKGVAYSEALAVGIPQLSGSNLGKARDALAERMTRMSSATLQDKLKDGNLEIRRAAALAAAMNEEKSFIGDLITLLNDPEPHVNRAAHAALKSLSSQDFGPANDAPAADRAKAIEKWKEWWAKNKGK